MQDQNKITKEDLISDVSFQGFENLTLTNSQKVYVTHNEYGHHEWSFDAPAHLLDDDNTLLHGKYSASNMITLFNVMPEIFAPVNEIASRVASINFVLKKFDDDQIVWDNKNFNRLFTQPNPLMDFKQHIWQAVVYEILTGASFQFINKPKLLSSGFDTIQTIINIPSDKIRIEADKTADPYTATEIKDFIKRVWIKRPNDTKRDFDLDRLIMLLHTDMERSNDVSKFKTQISGASAAIKNLIPVYAARNQIYVKRGALGFIVSKKSDMNGTRALTAVEKEEMQKEFSRNYGVTGQKNLFPIATNAVDFVKTSASIQEMQPFDETEQNARAIYAVLRVPKHLCPTKGNSTFNNADADLKSFYTDVIIPKAKHYALLFTNAFAIDGHYIDVDVSDIEILQSNKKDEADTAKTNGDVFEKQFKHGICTLNDWIVAIGGEASSDLIYDKRLFEMSEDEIAKIKKYINLNNSQQNNIKQ